MHNCAAAFDTLLAEREMRKGCPGTAAKWQSRLANPPADNAQRMGNK